MASSKTQQQLHFILVPLMAQGHMIPTIDIARMLAQRGVLVTIITTPLNASRCKSVISRAKESGLQIQLIELRFPCSEAGLPEGFENLDAFLSAENLQNFFVATDLFAEPVENFLRELQPPPSCLISDLYLPWSTSVARKLNIPRIVFDGMGCFSLLCWHNLWKYNVASYSESKRFVVPGLPHRIELTKSQVKDLTFPFGIQGFLERIKKEEEGSYGIIINTFQELEAEFVKEYEKVMGKKIWCIGPVSLYNRNRLDVAERGRKASIHEHNCVKWLDSMEPNSVIYVCLGSLSLQSTSQLIELGLGLEATNRPFLWVMRHTTNDFEKWISEEGFEERTEGKGLIVRGWAPQLVILSHKAVGGFMTHCGWNSTIEGISAGLPLITWPMFGEQFINEKLVVNVLKTGVSVGAEDTIVWPGEVDRIPVLIKKEDIRNAVDKLLQDEGEEGQQRRNRAKEFGELANKAVKEGGSSHLQVTQLIQDIAKQVN